jgi:hypothetical protein
MHARDARWHANGAHELFLNGAHLSHELQICGALQPRDDAWQLAHGDALPFRDARECSGIIFSR